MTAWSPTARMPSMRHPSQHRRARGRAPYCPQWATTRPRHGRSSSQVSQSSAQASRVWEERMYDAALLAAPGLVARGTVSAAVASRDASPPTCPSWDTTCAPSGEPAAEPAPVRRHALPWNASHSSLVTLHRRLSRHAWPGCRTSRTLPIWTPWSSRCHDRDESRHPCSSWVRARTTLTMRVTVAQPGATRGRSCHHHIYAGKTPHCNRRGLRRRPRRRNGRRLHDDRPAGWRRTSGAASGGPTRHVAGSANSATHCGGRRPVRAA